jgi:hypothetical protein
MWYTWGRREIHTGFWWGNKKESNLLADLDIGWEVNIKTRQASTYNYVFLQQLLQWKSNKNYIF